jgi:hypothetical protein
MVRCTFKRDGFVRRLSPKGVRFLVYGCGEKDATSSLSSSCGSFCSCFRGLETRQRQADKVAIRKRACCAVLTEQLKSTTVAQAPLHGSGSSTSPSGSQHVRRYDFNAIALAYKVRGKTTICQRRAHAVALDDELSALLSDMSHSTMAGTAAIAA